MMRLNLYLSVLFFLTACANHQQKVENTKKTDSAPAKVIAAQKTTPIPPTDTAFTLDYFPAVPDTINGCGDTYTFDTTAIARDKYIFLSNLTDFAIIRVKGVNIYLNRDSLASKEISEGSFITIFKGNGYKAILKAQKIKSYDEGGLYKGTLQITGDKVKAIFKVHGESGC